MLGGAEYDFLEKLGEATALWKALYLKWVLWKFSVE